MTNIISCDPFSSKDIPYFSFAFQAKRFIPIFHVSFSFFPNRFIIAHNGDPVDNAYIKEGTPILIHQGGESRESVREVVGR